MLEEKLSNTPQWFLRGKNCIDLVDFCNKDIYEIHYYKERERISFSEALECSIDRYKSFYWYPPRVSENLLIWSFPRISSSESFKDLQKKISSKDLLNRSLWYISCEDVHKRSLSRMPSEDHLWEYPLMISESPP